jgi:hypothetical protein
MDEATRKYNRRYYVADGGGCEMRKLRELLELVSTPPALA